MHIYILFISVNAVVAIKEVKIFSKYSLAKTATFLILFYFYDAINFRCDFLTVTQPDQTYWLTMSVYLLNKI